MFRAPHPFVVLTAQGGELGTPAEARVSLALRPSDAPRPWSLAFGRVVQPTPGRRFIRLADDAR